MKNLFTALFTLTLVIVSFNSCQEQQSGFGALVSTNDTSIIEFEDEIRSLGLDPTGAQQLDDFIIVEGDILLRREILSNLKNKKENTFQKQYTTDLTITTDIVYVSNPSSRPLPNFLSDALDTAIDKWNSIPECRIYFKRVDSSEPIPGQPATIYIEDAYGRLDGNVLGVAEFPILVGEGEVSPGRTILINPDFASCIPPQDRWVRTMAHELGHAIGFHHTNLSNLNHSLGVNLVPGTNTSDANSIMNRGSAGSGPGQGCNATSQFSEFDILAAETVYPKGCEHETTDPALSNWLQHPNGGVFDENTIVPIQWDASQFSGEKVVLGLYESSTNLLYQFIFHQLVGSTYDTNSGIAWEIVTDNDGEYDWTVPFIIHNSDKYRIRISGFEAPCTFDQSNEGFSISDSPDEEPDTCPTPPRNLGYFVSGNGSLEAPYFCHFFPASQYRNAERYLWSIEGLFGRYLEITRGDLYSFGFTVKTDPRLIEKVCLVVDGETIENGCSDKYCESPSSRRRRMLHGRNTSVFVESGTEIAFTELASEVNIKEHLSREIKKGNIIRISGYEPDGQEVLFIPGENDNTLTSFKKGHVYTIYSYESFSLSLPD